MWPNKFWIGPLLSEFMFHLKYTLQLTKVLVQEHIYMQIGKYRNLSFSVSNSLDDLSLKKFGLKINLNDSL